MNSSTLTIDEQTHNEIQRLCALGDSLAKLDQHREALTQYNKAWELIPSPRNNWEASIWVLAAIADSSFYLGHFAPAQQALDYAMTCPGGLGNPFLHLRRGQVLFEFGEMDSSAEELMRAYMGGGSENFATEAPKYLLHLKTKANLCVDQNSSHLSSA
jgi:tetratricopeptide (TPR) repeat protein